MATSPLPFYITWQPAPYPFTSHGNQPPTSLHHMATSPPPLYIPIQSNPYKRVVFKAGYHMTKQHGTADPPSPSVLQPPQPPAVTWYQPQCSTLVKFSAARHTSHSAALWSSFLQHAIPATVQHFGQVFCSTPYQPQCSTLVKFSAARHNSHSAALWSSFLQHAIPATVQHFGQVFCSTP